MEGLPCDVEKLRSASTTSSTSSVIEYVNEVFTESELVTSRSVSIEVSGDTQWIKNPMNEEPNIQNGVKELKTLQNVTEFTPDRKHSLSSLKIRTLIPGLRNMYIAAFVVLLFAVCMGMGATYSATATKDMEKPHSTIHPNEDEVTWIGSLMAIGALIGGTAGGYFTNAVGRKGALVLNIVPFVVGWMFIVYANSTGLIYLGRIVTGFSCGIVTVATPMYLVEISTPEVRGLLGGSFQLFVVIGVLIIASLGSTLTWRYSATAGGLMCLLAGLLMVPMPESPRWLMSQKRRGEAKNALIFLQGKSYDAEGECVKMEEEILSQPKGTIQLRELAAPEVRKPFILSIALMFFQQFSGVNAIMFYTVAIFEAAHSTMDSILATIVVSIVQVIATGIGSLLMDRAGRKLLLIVSGICMALSLIVFGCFDFAREKDEQIVDAYGWLPVVCLMSFIAAFSIGFGPTPWLMVAEMTPSRFRGIVSGISTALNWTFVFIITKSFKAEEHAIHAYGVYWLYASFCIASLFMTHFFLPETKGKSMEEIQDFFLSK